MKIFSLKLHKLFRKDLLQEIEKILVSTDQTQGKLLFTPNPEICLKMRKDQEFFDVLSQADYLTSDGIGLYLAYQMRDKGFLQNFVLLPLYFGNVLFRKKYLYEKYGERITGSALTKDILGICEKNAVEITILDLYNPSDEEKVASQKIFSQKLQEAFPELKCNYIIYREEKKESIFGKISTSENRVVFTTLGMKSQEVLARDVRDSCLNVRLTLGVGSSFDYIIGFQKSAPEIYKTLGLEWLYRLGTSPNRWNRVKRIFRAVIVFPFVVLKESKKGDM